MRTEETHALLGNSSKLEQRDHLETERTQSFLCQLGHFFLESRSFLPATIGQQIPIPSLQLMSTTNSIQHLLSRFQAKVICIVQAEHTSSFAQLVIRQAFE